MLLLSFVLLPVVLAATIKSPSNEYVIKIKYDTLISVEATKTSSDVLNLSGYGIQRIEDHAFKNLVSLKILKLDNNSLYDLPPFLFSNLTNLEHLSLANNSLDSFANVFIGLGNLKTLNISNNLVRVFKSNDFYGLSSHIDIYTLGNPLEIISTAFMNPKKPQTSEGNPSGRVKRDLFIENFRTEICISEGIVSRLENLGDGETVSEGCREVETYVSYVTITLSLENLGITGFESGWYRLNPPSRYPSFGNRKMIILHLEGNNIVRVTKEFLNDLPSKVGRVILANNKIERLDNGIIVNAYLEQLNLTNNRISIIEPGALLNTNITELYLDGNRLTNADFMATLPPSIEILFAARNRIPSFSESPIPILDNLKYLYFDQNRITFVGRKSLQSFKSLVDLSLSDNQITTVVPGCFSELRSLMYLNLRKNHIANIESGVFEGLNKFVFVDLGSNKLEKIEANTMPRNSSTILLDNNKIDILEAGSFAHMPINQLVLAGNNISVIPKGTFNVPNQKWVNKVTKSDLLTGLQRLHLMQPFKPFIAKNMKFKQSVSYVDLSNNTIKKLENGMLFGIRKNKSNSIYVSGNPIELVQGGLFDDM